MVHCRAGVIVMRRFSLLAVASLSFVAASVAAKDKNEDKTAPTPPVFQAVLDCKSVIDSTERLACFDRTVDVMATANIKREILVAERETVKEAERGLFGLSLPKIKIFGGNDDDAVKEIESTIASFRRDENGALVITIADGARWKQTDSYPQSAKVGDKIKLKKGAFGSFFANINGKSGFKVTRITN
jgi:hypothetical protein